MLSNLQIIKTIFTFGRGLFALKYDYLKLAQIALKRPLASTKLPPFGEAEPAGGRGWAKPSTSFVGHQMDRRAEVRGPEGQLVAHKRRDSTAGPKDPLRGL